jgi:predicted P-loop ATPase
VAGKSELFKALFGAEFFGPLSSQGSAKDWSMCLSQVWAAELGELEAFTGKHASGILKAFISESQDLYRAPYNRTAKKHPRHSILVATGNTQSPLVDYTGNRRWWFLQSPDKINLGWVRENRDTIWSSAMQKYHAGEAYWFSGEEERAAMDSAESYRTSDPWEEILGEFLGCIENPELASSSEQIREMLLKNSLLLSGTRKNLTTSELLMVLGVEEANQTRTLATRLGEVMSVLGYKQVQKRIEGKSPRVWVLDTPIK